MKLLPPNSRPVSKYLDVLACPTCKSPLAATQTTALDCLGCGRRYSVIHNCPNLLPPMGQDGWSKWKAMDEMYLQSYEQWTKEEHLAARGIYEQFIDWCRIRDIRDVRLLDVGGGNGVMRAMCWHHPETIDYFNIDPKIEGVHPFYLELYPGLDSVDFPYVIGIAESLPFQSESFDLCVTAESVDHWLDPQSGFHEILRCLKPGGKLFILAPKHIETDAPRASGFARALSHLRQHGVVSLSRRVVVQLGEWWEGASPAFEHMHNFGSLEELVEMLTMFDVSRTHESAPICVGSNAHLFIECVKHHPR